MGAFISPFFPKSLFKNPGDEDGFPAKGGLMTVLRQGRIVLPLWDHEKKAIFLGGSPISGRHQKLGGTCWVGGGISGLYGA